MPSLDPSLASIVARLVISLSYSSWLSHVDYPVEITQFPFWDLGDENPSTSERVMVDHTDSSKKGCFLSKITIQMICIEYKYQN